MACGVVLGTEPRHEERLDAKVDGLGRDLRCAVKVGQRYVADGQQAGVHRTERDLGAIRCGCGPVEQIQVVAVLQFLEPHVGRGREHKLAGDTDQVQRLASVFPTERSRRGVVLAQHDLVGVCGSIGGVVVTCDGLGKRRSVPGVEPRVEGVAYAVRGEVVQPMGKFHGVGVRVVDNAVGDIGHGGAGGGVGAILTPTPAGFTHGGWYARGRARGYRWRPRVRRVATRRAGP